MQNQTFGTHELNSNSVYDSITSIGAYFRPHSDVRITINRPILLSKDYYNDREPRYKKFLSSQHNRLFQFCQISKLVNLLNYFLPILHWLPRYSLRQSLPADLLAGLTMSTSQISDGLAFGWLAGLSPANGLYMSIFPVIVYAIFGRSRHLSIGTFPVVSIVCQHVLEAFNVSPPTDNLTSQNVTLHLNQTQSNMNDPIQILTSLALLVGLIQLFVGLFRLDMLFSLLSDPILSAFSTAAPILILVNQLFPMLGLNRSDSNPVPGMQDMPFKFIKSGARLILQLAKINPTTASLALGTVAVLLLSKCLFEFRWRRRCLVVSFSIDLLAVLALTAACRYFNLSTEHVQTQCPSPLHPSPSLPNVSLWPRMLLSATLIAFVTFSGAYSTGRIHAKEHKYQVKGNQEMFALGAANVLSSFLHCYPCGSSSIRSAKSSQIGQKSQVASLISVLLVGLFAKFGLKYLESVPVSALTAIIVATTISITYTKLQKAVSILKGKCIRDGITWFVTFVSILFLGTRYGLVCGISVSLVFVARQIVCPKLSLKHAIAGTECYITNNIENCSSPRQIVKSGAIIFEIAGPLIYLNVEHLRCSFSKIIIETFKCNRKRNESIFTLNSLSSTKLTSGFDMAANSADTSPHHFSTIHSVILDCSALSFIDKKGIELLNEFENEIRQTSLTTKLVLAQCNCNVLQSLKQAQFNINRCYLSVHDAVVACAQQLTNG